MLGHLATSSAPAAVVIRRQLFPPKPSSRPSEASFGPHQDGTSPFVVVSSVSPPAAVSVVAEIERQLG